ncbi:MAG: chemotaxis protein CheA [Fusobacteriia bacterium 4572_132]|nr:MAG: chemotaxis protein CheA [Fusobacteriia bacterium 4572_132]
MDTMQYMSVFVDESREHLQNLNETLLLLEKEPTNLKIVEEIFRSAHTLKGMAATMGFESTTELTHNLENILDLIRNKKMSVSTEIVDLLFECLDTLNLLTDEIIEDGKEESDINYLVEQLEEMTKKKDSGPNSKENKKVKNEVKEEKIESLDVDFNEYEKQVLEEAKSKGMNNYIVNVTLDESCLLKAARVYMVFKNLEELGEIIKSSPTTEDLEEEKFDNSFMIVYVTKEEKEKIQKSVLNISEIEKVEMQMINLSKEKVEVEETENKPKKKKAEGEKKKKGTTTTTHKATTTVRVDTEKLDSLMNLVAELVINKTRLSQLSTEHNLDDLSETLAHVDRVTGDLQSVVTQVRMVPIETVFNRFPRMIRDLSKSLNKEIDLIIEGKETELDRTVIDEIGDPLVHLLRNSIDHGIGTPEERKKVGKTEKGRILLKAEHEGNNVVITIADNGKGIDAKVIAKKAIEKGIATQEEVDEMEKDEILNFIFSSGFSTAEKITNVSGRGVGMDVVRTKIEAINGKIEMETELGKGTITKVKLPLTLAIIEALLVKLKEEIYAIPLANIVETVDVKKEEIKVVQGEKVIILRGEVVPVINLGNVLEVPDYEQKLQNNNYTLVIVKVGSKKLGLTVDDLIGQQEIVIKPLGKLFVGLKGITGATVLGNGEVALILDVLTLI